MPQYKMKILQVVLAASGRRDVKNVTKWIKAVEGKNMKLKTLAKSGKGFETLDMKMASAIHKTLHGEFGKTVSIKEQRNIREHYRPLTGRQLLWMIFDHTRTNHSLEGVFKSVDMMTLQWKGDGVADMVSFRNDWDYMLEHSVGHVSSANKAEWYLVNLGKSVVLKSQVDEIRRKRYKPKKQYIKLRNILDDHVALHTELANRDQQVSALKSLGKKSKYAAPAEGTEVCVKYLYGKCKNKNCNRLHPPNQDGIMKDHHKADAAPAQPPAKGGKGGKGDGKQQRDPSRGRPKGKGGGKDGKTRGNSKDSKGSRGSGKGGKGSGKSKKNLPCMKFNSPGGCDKSEKDCLYAHRIATPEEKAKFPKPRSPSPAGRRQPCFAWFKDRTCRFGDKCKFSHDPKDAPRA